MGSLPLGQEAFADPKTANAKSAESEERERNMVESRKKVLEIRICRWIVRINESLRVESSTKT